MPLPHASIQKIPNNEPDATPELWNATYRQIDANFANHENRVAAAELTMEAAKGSHPSLPSRLNSLESTAAAQSEDADNNKVLATLQALNLASMALKGVENLKVAAQQQGEVTISNRGLVSGCEASKSTTATRNLNFTAGVCFARGRRYAVNGTTNAASVPSNSGSAPATVYAYLFLHSSGEWRPAVTPIGTAVPDGAIVLYQITIPAGNTDATDPQLSNVTLTSLRRMEPQFPLMLDAPVARSIAINQINSNDYQLSFDVVSATGAPCNVSAIVATSRATNGFTVELHSAADDVRIRWRLSRLSQ